MRPRSGPLTYLGLLALWSLTSSAIWLILLLIPFAIHLYVAIALVMFPPVLYLLAFLVTAVIVREEWPSSS